MWTGEEVNGAQKQPRATATHFGVTRTTTHTESSLELYTRPRMNVFDTQMRKERLIMTGGLEGTLL